MLRSLRSVFFRVLGAALMLVHTVQAQAQGSLLPSGGQVTAGSATISSSGNQLTVNQSSNRAIIDWQSFSIGQGASVNFNMPGSGSAILNRVTGDAPSTIAGTLTGNGQVYLVNPNGIAITPSGMVKVGGGFVASTLPISNGDFLAGILNFSGNSSGSVSNAGNIYTGRGGYVALLSNDSVSNSGTISAPAGRVALGTGSAITLDPSGTGFMQIMMPSTRSGSIDVPGVVRARGGRIEIKAAAVERAVRNIVNVGGSLNVSSVRRNGGVIVLEGSGGGVNVAGRLAASSQTKQGGRISIDGSKIALADATLDVRGKSGGGRVEIGNQTQAGKTATVSIERATIDASSRDGGATSKGGDISITAGVITIKDSAFKANGSAGGGQILIGGDYQGRGTLAHAQTVSIAKSSFEADALLSGNAGRIIVWSDKATTVGGSFSARALGTSGDGGLVETSSHGVLTLTDARADASSARGRAGLWLLDPQNLTIDAAAAANISAALTSSNVTITTSPSCLLASCGTWSAGAGTITLNAAITKTGSAATTLTLLADANIVLNAGITASGGTLTLNLTAAGNVSGSGALNTNGGALTITAGSGSGILSGIISGAGSLIKNGAGSLVLSGANTYSGITTVNAGTLQIGNGGTTGTLGSGAVVNNATLAFNRTDTLTLTQAISGTGTLNQNGSGKVVLSGTNTYSGTTNINAGTLQVLNTSTTANIGTIGSGNIVIAAGAKLQITNSRNNGYLYVIANTISGAGSLLLDGPNAAITQITGNNTFSGGTTILSGAYAIGSDTAFGTGGIVMSGGGILGYGGTRTIANAFTLSGTVGFGASTNLTGAITLAGNTTLTTAGTFGGSVWSGTLNLGSYTLSTAVTGPNTTLNGVYEPWRPNYTLTIAGNISGTGGITHNAPGVLILSGVNTYTGATTVMKGRLQFAKLTSLYQGVSSNWNASRIIVASGGILAVNYGGAGEFAASDLDVLKSLGTATGGFLSGSFLGIDTSSGSQTYASNIANTNGGANALGIVKLGWNTLTLSGANTFTGSIANNGGTLDLAGSWNVGAGTASMTVVTGSLISGTGVITAGTLSRGGGGSVSLTGANRVGSLVTTSTTATTIFNNAQTLSLGTINSGMGQIVITTTSGDLIVNSGANITAASGTVTLAAAGNLTLSAGAKVIGASPVLSAGGAFINNSGSGAVVASSGRWLIYSASPGGNTFGSLDSGNTAIWNATYGSLAPDSVTATGNRYLFAMKPTLTITTTSSSKRYGTDINVGNNYIISGYQPGVTGAFRGDTAASVFSGAPVVTSAGAGSSASVAGGPYTVTATQGTLTALSGYDFAFVNSGTVTVTPVTLTVNANAQTKTYGAADPSLTYNYSGLVNGDTSSVFTGKLTRDAGENVAGGPYAIKRGTLDAGSNYIIAYNGAQMTITPATLNVVADNHTKTFGSGDPTFTYRASGLADWDDESVLSGSLTRAPGENPFAGAYAIRQGSLKANSNYVLTFTDGSLTIKAAEVGARSIPVLNMSALIFKPPTNPASASPGFAPAGTDAFAAAPPRNSRSRTDNKPLGSIKSHACSGDAAACGN